MSVSNFIIGNPNSAGIETGKANPNPDSMDEFSDGEGSLDTTVNGVPGEATGAATGEATGGVPGEATGKPKPTGKPTGKPTEQDTTAKKIDELIKSVVQKRTKVIHNKLMKELITLVRRKGTEEQRDFMKGIEPLLERDKMNTKKRKAANEPFDDELNDLKEAFEKKRKTYFGAINNQWDI